MKKLEFGMMKHFNLNKKIYILKWDKHLENKEILQKIL